MNSISERSTKKEIWEAYKTFEQQSAIPSSSTIVSHSKEKEQASQRDESTSAALDALNELNKTISGILTKFSSQVNDLRKRIQEEEEMLSPQIQQKRSDWAREQEEYTYQITMQRKKEQDEYTLKTQERERQFNESLAARDQALQEREETFKQREEEIKELRSNVESFPGELSRAVNEAIIKTKAEAEQKAKIAAELTQKDTQREREIAKLTIEGLEDTIKHQASQIVSFERQLTQALQRVQELAVTALESSGFTAKRGGFEQEQQEVKGKK